MLPLYWSPVFTDALDPAARFPRLRYRLVRAALEARGAAGWARITEPPRASLERVRATHDPDFVERFVRGDLDAREERRVGLRPWRPEIVDRTLAIVGGTLAATQDVLHGGHAVAGNLSGGTHHAHADFGSGYCIFNDLAVATRWALAEGVGRVLIVDLDVHQGDGTAAIFAGEPRVFTFSMHCDKNFPFRKQASDLDVALPERTGDEAYLDALDQHLEPLFDAVHPGLVLFQAGVDPLAEDTLGRLALTRAGLAARNDRVFAAARARGVPMVVTMGGGYAEPLEASVEAHADVFEGAARAFGAPLG